MKSALRFATWFLAAAAVLAFAHVLARLPRAPLELSPALSERLARMDSQLLLTYAASPAATLPSELRAVPGEVEELLRAIEAAGAGRVSVQIVDPGADAGVASYLAAVGLAPFRARALEVDLEVEREVWSALRIAYGPHGAAVIRTVTPAVLPDLQALILSHLDLLERPRQPRVALAAPLAFNHLRRELRTRAELLECDFEIDARVPEEADLLLWIDPSTCGAAHVAALRALLGRGGSIVIAGRVPPELSTSFGLASVDANLEPLVRATGPDQDFRPLAGGRSGPNGTLLFAEPAPFVPAAGRLRELGLDLFPLASWSRSSLLVLLAPDARADPRQGSLVFSASSSPFSDAYLRHDAFAHRELLTVLVSSLASAERLAISSAELTRPVVLPELAPARRNFLSLAVVLAAPLILLLAALSRAGRRSLPSVRFRPYLLLAGSAAISALLFARFAPEGASVDLTRAGLNELAPGSRSIAAAIAAPTRIELCFSPDAELPPRWRGPVREARALARRFAEAGSSIAVVDAPPDAVDPEALAALAREGILPIDPARSSFAAIRIVGAAPAPQVLSFPELAGFEHLEFRLAAALARVAHGTSAPRVALLASAPKLTPAEAFACQQRGLHPPGGGDRFGEARALLEANDFVVRELDSEQPELEPGIDVLLCLEPRRDAAPAIGAVAKHLSTGGNALLAAQHFGVRPQRTQAAHLELSVRPEPWFADVERLYFPSIGIELVRELLFDEQHGTSEVQTEIEREARRFEMIPDLMTSPLVVRATASGFDAHSPITRGISELDFVSPNRLRVDSARQREIGITAREVISTSERAWSHDWKGGPLPAAVLDGPAPGPYLGRQPLAMFFEGSFPPPGTTPDLAAVPGGAAPGRLLLIGCSQVFADESLRAAGGDAAQLLLNSVASLALPADQAAILAHRAATPALGHLEPGRVILWRIAVVCVTPVLLLLFGLLRARRRAVGAAA
ncbi:MAG: Gldg family protein [Planctomycetota bacterium]